MYTALACDMYTHAVSQQDIMRNKRKGENGLLSLLCRINIFHEPRSPSLISLWHPSLLSPYREKKQQLGFDVISPRSSFFYFFFYLFLTRKVPHGRLREPAETTRREAISAFHQRVKCVNLLSTLLFKRADLVPCCVYTRVLVTLWHRNRVSKSLNNETLLQEGKNSLSRQRKRGETCQQALTRCSSRHVSMASCSVIGKRYPNFNLAHVLSAVIIGTNQKLLMSPK